MRILLLSAYDAASHQYWRKGLVAAFPEHEWTVLILPPRYFAWRVRGNAMSWAISENQTLKQPYDRIIATSFTDLATLKGLMPEWSDIPIITYFHENQFAYPHNSQSTADSGKTSVESQITSIYTALASDVIVFNSSYNQQTFVDGVASLLKKMPDFVPADIAQMLRAKSQVLPVPLNENCFSEPIRKQDGPFTLVWNHRWEYDKGPDRLYLLLKHLKAAGLDFRIHIIGQQFRNQPKEFDKIYAEFQDNIGQWGFVENRSQYQALLRRSHIVLSTSLHDFQGLSMQEAMAAGCIPVAANRLAYPEYIPAEYLVDSCPDDAEQEAKNMAACILDLAKAMAQGNPPEHPDVSKLSWYSLREEYNNLFTGT